MKVLGIIPARYGSSRFPGKPLARIGTRTLIERVYRRASRAKNLDALCVATDHPLIAEHVEQFGGIALMTSAEHQNGTSRCLEAAQHFTSLFANGKNPQIVINIQGDEPLIIPELIDSLAEMFHQPQVQIVSAVCPFISFNQLNDPATVKVVMDNQNKALYFSRLPVPYFRDGKPDLSIYRKHIGIYAYRYQTLTEIAQLASTTLEQAEMLEQLRWLAYGFDVHLVQTEYQPLGVDLPEHIQEVEQIIKSFYPDEW